MTHRSVEDRVQMLLDATGQVMEAAYADEAAAKHAIKALERTRGDIEQKITTLASQVTGTIDQFAATTASEAARLLSEKFADADREANAAAERYRMAARRVGWKLTGVMVAVMAVALVSAWLVVRLALPSQADIDSRRAMVAQLDARVAQLRKQVDDLDRKGARVELSTCKAEDGSVHLCVRTNETDYPAAFGTTYRIPAGY